MTQQDSIEKKTLREFLRLLPKEEELLIEEFSGELNSLRTKVMKIIEARAQLKRIIPNLNEIDFSHYEIEKSKCAWDPHTGKITEYAVVVIDHTNANQQVVHKVCFSDREYPGQNIKQGFTVYAHNDSRTYQSFWHDSFGEFWNEVTDDQDLSRTLIGVALHQSAHQYVSISLDNADILFVNIKD